MARKKNSSSAPSAAAPVVLTPEDIARAAEHQFVFYPGSSFEACPCGLEREVTLVGGAVVRRYREIGNRIWDNVARACPKYVAPKAAEPPPAVASPPGTKSSLLIALEGGLSRRLRARDYWRVRRRELADGQTHGDVLRQLIGEAFPAEEENSHETA